MLRIAHRKTSMSLQQSWLATFSPSWGCFPPHGVARPHNPSLGLENAHWTAITLMQGRVATVDQMATVKVTGLPAATWMQVIQCLRLSHFDSVVVLSTMDEGTFNRCVEFIARLAHSNLHELMGMAKPYASFVACQTVRAWHGANHTLGSCFSTPKPTKPAPSALQKPPTSAAEGHPEAAAAHLPGGEGATPMPSPHTM